MSNSTRLAADTAMGPVTLDVADLDAMTAYYRDAVGLSVLAAEGPVVTLGHAGGTSAAAPRVSPSAAGAVSDMSAASGAPTPEAQPLVILRHSPALTHAGPREAGLFHTAILFETQQALAAAVYTVATMHPGRFTGSSDHLVSQAFYFDDPEGNGVELYWDRTRTEWSWVHGSIEMATLFLDPNAFLREHLTDEARAAHGTAASVVGHVHLSVGDVATAQHFYVDQLGFDLTMAYGGQAIFVSAGGYHHHMAMNVWRSAGAGRRMPALGLGHLDIMLPTADELGATAERLTHHGLALRDDGRTLEVDDPWGTQIRLIATT